MCSRDSGPAGRAGLTSAWASCDAQGEFHTRCGVGTDMSEEADRLHHGSRDLKCKTWYLNKARLSAWDLYPVLVKIEEKEMKIVQGKKGWAGWISRTEEERWKFEKQVLCPKTLNLGLAMVGRRCWCPCKNLGRNRMYLWK